MPTILIVDDDSNNQRMLSYTLRKAGYEVLTASNGQMGLAALDAYPVDLAVADLAMPIMDGLTMLRRMRADERFNSIPVIILTASNNDQDRIIAEDIGVSGLLLKPVSSRNVLDVVKKVLAK